MADHETLSERSETAAESPVRCSCVAGRQMSRYADNLYPPFDGYPRPWAVMSRAGTFYVARQMAPYDLARPGMLMQPLVGPSGRKVSFRSRSAAQTRADELNNRTKQETTDG